MFSLNQNLRRKKKAHPPLDLTLQEITQAGSKACSEVSKKEEDAPGWKGHEVPCDSGLINGISNGIIRKVHLISAIPDFKRSTSV